VGNVRTWAGDLPRAALRARRFCRLLLASVLIFHGTPAAHGQSTPELTITSPAAGQILSGTWTFSASAPPTVATVEFTLGSLRLGVAPAPDFGVSWNTGYAADGSYFLRAIGRDALGNVIAKAEQPFTINNYGDSMVVNSPDLSRPLSGTVLISVTGFDSQYFPAAWPMVLDGVDRGDFYTDTPGAGGGKNQNTITINLDTTAVPNGEHELYLSFHSNYWTVDPHQQQWYDWRGAYQRVVTIDNGHTLMGVAANYLHVYLRPGEQLRLGCRQLFTDRTRGACVSPSYSSSDSAVVSVSAHGIATAGGREGFATVILTDGGKSAQVYIWVRNRSGVPHFSGDGRVLRSYRPRASTFVVAPFQMGAEALASDPVLLAEAKKAGVNTVTDGFYLPSHGRTDDYVAWQNAFNSVVASKWSWAATNGFHVLATGDDLCRQPGVEGYRALNWPSAPAAVQYAAQSLASSGVGIGIDMVDETDLMWGEQPKPPGRIGASGSFDSVTCSTGSDGTSTCTVEWPSNPLQFQSNNFALGGSAAPALNTPAGQLFSAGNVTADSFSFTPASPINGTFDAGTDPGLEFVWWSNVGGCPSFPCDPLIPNDAITTFRKWIKSATPTVPISWPVLGSASPRQAANWMGPAGVSDYASQYWVSGGVHTYRWSQGIAEDAHYMRQTFYNRQPLMMLDRPQLILQNFDGPAYIKETTSGGYFDPPTDILNQPGPTGPTVNAEMMTAAALGAAGERLYFWEPDGVHIGSPPGTFIQTGINPTADDWIVRGDWRAMAYAAKPLTTTLAPYVLGRALSSPAYGENIVSAARQGRGARMLMIVNDNDWERTLRINFTPYRYGYNITRYRINSRGIATKVLTDRPGETMTLAAGETVVYLFHASAQVRFTRRIILRPRTFLRYLLLRSIGIGIPGKVVLNYSYIYPDGINDRQQTIDCSNGCVLDLDPNLGDVYYQFTYVDHWNRVLDRSAIQVLTEPTR
jgi:Bacterial Ig domain